MAALVTAGVASAKGAALDGQYGGDGVADTDPAFDTMSANALRVLDDGTVVFAAGKGVSTGITRVRPDGTVDPVFAAFVPTPANYVSALTVDPLGRVVTAETSGSAVLVRRFLPIGQPDATFGSGGVLTLPVPQIDSAVADVQVDHRGRIGVLYRQRRYPQPGDECVVTRRLATGMVDPTFNGGAPLSLAMPYNQSMGAECLDLVVRGDDGMYIADRFAGIAAISQGGAVEPGHGTGAYDFAQRTSGGISDTRLLPGDALALGGTLYGTTSFGDGWQFAVAELTARGDLDPSFGADGVSTVGFGDLQPGYSTGWDNNDRLAWLGITADDDLVAVGGTSSGLAIARWQAGQPDTTFGTGGRLVIPDESVGLDRRLSSPIAGAIGRDGAAYVTSNRQGSLPPLTLVRIADIGPSARRTAI